jgi:hypothetical protein
VLTPSRADPSWDQQREGAPAPVRHGPASRAAWLAVLVASLAVAGARAHDVARDARSGWLGLAHDRNGHYAFAQQLARAARTARPA